MASSPDQISMAVFCDFENVALGVRDANYDKFDIKPILERLLLKGSIVVKKAYCDWERYKGFKATMHEANFELIEIPHVRQSGKNSADIRLVVDALDLCYTKSHVNTFVIISGDSDFSPLVSKLRENDKKVIGVGVKQSTSDLLVAGCDEFIFYDDLVREIKRAAAKRDERKVAPPARRSPDEGNRRKEETEARKTQAIELVVEMFDALVSERGDSGKIWASLLKDTLKRRRPDFNETYYGFRTFGNLLEEAQNRGMLEFGRDEKSGAYVYRSSNAAQAAAAPQGEQNALEAIEQDEPNEQPDFSADEQDEQGEPAAQGEQGEQGEELDAQDEQAVPREQQPPREQQAQRNEGAREGREGREGRRRGGRGRNKGGEQKPAADAVASDIGGGQAVAASEIDEDEALDIAYLARATANKAAQDKRGGGGGGGGGQNKRSGGRPAPQDKRANKPASQEGRRDGRGPRDERKPAARAPYRSSGAALSQVEQEQLAYAAQEVARERAQEAAQEAAERAAARAAAQQAARAPKPAPQAAAQPAAQPAAPVASSEAAEPRAKPARKPAAPKAAKAKPADAAPAAAPVDVAASTSAPAKAAKPARARAAKPAAEAVAQPAAQAVAKPAAPAAKKPAAAKAPKAAKPAAADVAAEAAPAAKPARKSAARKPAKAAAE